MQSCLYTLYITRRKRNTNEISVDVIVNALTTLMALLIYLTCGDMFDKG